MRTEVLKGALLSTLVIALMMVPAISLLSVSPSSAAPEGLTPRDPIYIDGNDNFTFANGVNGGGSGTAGDPYNIENWAISAGNTNGIEIRNTTAHFIIRNCVVENVGGTYSGIYLNNVVNGRVVNNISSNNNGYYSIHLSASDNNRISSNLVENNNNIGIYLYYSDHNTLSNNTCKNSGYGIYLYTSSDNNIIENNTCGNNFTGIYLHTTENNILTNNTCEKNNNGICLASSDKNTVKNNTCKKNIQLGTNLVYTGHGIYLSRSDNNIISNNICENNSSGIFLYYQAKYNIFKNNTCGNNDNGIYLYYESIYNIFKNNTCENNNIWGIILINSSNNNRIYHNNFINNDNQAYDDGTNTWDNGYPSGGNYWSDYTGKDENHGENQDIPSWSDGIGDTPYNIPVGANKDFYPLVIRDVEVIIEPDNQPGVIGENVVFTVTVKNKGNVWDNYNLTPSDDAGWALKLDNDYLEIPKNENRETILTVSIPDNENLVCTTDNITVVATAVDNAEVTDNDNATIHAVPSWTGTAVFSLVNLYTVNVEKILDLLWGSKLVVKFYTYGDGYESENVIETFSPPLHVEENESARHPVDLGVKKARLDLTTDDTSNVISTMASFTVRKIDLEVRFTEIPLEWALAATPEEKTALEIEFSDIPFYWALAPS